MEFKVIFMVSRLVLFMWVMCFLSWRSVVMMCRSVFVLLVSVVVWGLSI